MAITNAQQYQQLVNPPMKGKKRPGYRGIGGYQEGKSESVSSGNTTGNTTTGGGDNRPDPGFQNALRQQKIEQKKKEARDDGGFRETGSVKYSPPSFFQGLKNNIFQGGINRNKVQSLRTMGLLDKGLPGFFGKVISGVTGKVPDWAKDMTEEEIKEMAADIQGIKDYNQATYNYNLNPDLKGSGSELLGRTFDAQDILDSGKMTQSKYEELFPGPTLPKDGDGNQDPCKGPNPPAYCFTGLRSASAATPEVEEDEIINYRLMAGGGRAGLAEGGMPYEGGIMDLESSRQMYGLGKLVKKVTRSVKKIAKSPIGKAAILAAGGYALGGGFGTAAGGFKKATLLSRLGLGGFENVGANRIFQKNALGKFLTNKATLGIGIPAITSYFMTPEEEEEQKLASLGADIDDPSTIINNPYKYTNPRLMAEGGSTEKEPVAKKVMPLLDMDGKEKDYRETGGFVDMGRMEKADDVPARLSKNEFVFTADAVRNAGDGSVDKGAEVMYNMMKNLESGGDVSEESQGLEGARDMFQTSQRLEEVL